MSDVAPLGATTSPGDTGLEVFVGKSIEAICTSTGFGAIGDAQNHCAHFVGHALRFTSGIGFKCSQMDKRSGFTQSKDFKQMGVLIRVHEFYNNNNLTNKTELDITDFSKAPTSGLIFVTKTSNFSKDLATMGNIPRKHIGIIKDGFVYHYGNTDDAVRKDTVAKFVTRMTSAYGGSVKFTTTALPKG